jgi:hypothetical protein
VIAFETEAVLENDRTLRLQRPVYSNHPEAVRVILLLDEASKPAPEWPELFFETHYGSCESDPLDDAKDLVYETNRLPLE